MMVRSTEQGCEGISLPVEIIYNKRYCKEWNENSEVIDFLKKEKGMRYDEIINKTGGFGTIYSVLNETQNVIKITSFREYLRKKEYLVDNDRYISAEIYEKNIQKFWNEGYIHVKMKGKEFFPETQNVVLVQIMYNDKYVDNILCIKMRKYEVINFSNMSEREMLILTQNVLECLQTAHDFDLVHRDIKPENILYDPINRKYVLIDWGATKVFEQTTTALPVYSRGYIAPERANYYLRIGSLKANADRDVRSDIYSLGAVMYYWANCCSMTPLITLNGKDASIEILSPEYERLKRGSDVYRKIMMTALHKKPEMRYSSASKMKNAIEECVKAQDFQTAEECLVPDVIKERIKYISQMNSTDYKLEANKYTQLSYYLWKNNFGPFVYEESTEDVDLIKTISASVDELLSDVKSDGTSAEKEILGLYYADVLYGMKTKPKETKEENKDADKADIHSEVKRIVEEWEQKNPHPENTSKKKQKKNKIWIWLVIFFVLLFGGICSNLDKVPHITTNNGNDINNELITDKISGDVVWEQFIKQTYEKSKEEVRLNSSVAKNKMLVGSTLPTSITHGQTKSIQFEVYTETIPAEISVIGLNERNISTFYDISKEDLNNGVISFNYTLDAGKEDVPNSGKYRVRLCVKYADDSGKVELGKVYENYYLDTYIMVEEDMAKVGATKQPSPQTDHNTNISVKDYPSSNNQTTTKKSDDTSTVATNNEKKENANNVERPIETVETTNDDIEARCPVCNSKFHTEHPQTQAPDIPMDFE